MTSKTWNKTVSFMYIKDSGNAFSMPIDERSLNQLQEVLGSMEVGGKLVFKKLTEEARSKFRSKFPPTHALEYMAASAVSEFETTLKKKTPTKTTSVGI